MIKQMYVTIFTLDIAYVSYWLRNYARHINISMHYHNSLLAPYFCLGHVRTILKEKKSLKKILTSLFINIF